MKPRAQIGFLTAVLAMGLAAGCSTSPMSRIDANRAVYDTWPLEVQQAVLNGRAEKGMTPEMVRVSLGEPTKIENRDGKNGEEEVWIYSKGGGASSLLGNTSIQTGGMIGPVGVSGPPVSLGNGGSGGGEETDVVFQNGVVVRSNTL